MLSGTLGDDEDEEQPVEEREHGGGDVTPAQARGEAIACPGEQDDARQGQGDRDGDMEELLDGVEDTGRRPPRARASADPPCAINAL
jgi:hypothetical protein